MTASKEQSPEVEPGAALRAELGLAEDERLRIIQRDGRLVVLERGHAEGIAAAVPSGCDLSLCVDVRAFALADLMKLVHGSGKSGLVLLVQGDLEKCVYMNRGEVIFAASNQRVDRLGDSLLRSGTITLEQLRRADARWEPGMRFGKVLVELGILTPRELWGAVKAQVEEIVRSLFAHTAGTLYFWEGEVQPDNIVRLALPTRRLIAEGLERREALFRYLARLVDPLTRIDVLETALEGLPEAEARLLGALASESGFSAVCRRVGMDPLAGAQIVQLLELIGALEIAEQKADAGFLGEGDLRTHEEDRLRECVFDHVKLISELSAPIVAIEGAAAVTERVARLIEEVALRHPALLDGLELGPAGGLDPEVILRRALRLSGDRMQAVAEALGEIDSYLAFELKNHPDIEGAEIFLEAVEGLRAKLEA